MTILKLILLSIVQGAAELLPVSSSAHVILAEKMMGLDPTSPELTFLLVMLHTGTMFAVLFYFWPRWKALLMADAFGFIKKIVVATALTGFIGLGLKTLIEKVIMSHPDAEIEHLFGNLPMMATALFTVGLIIVLAGSKKTPSPPRELGMRESALIGIMQGICLPFRGFSRSGATISAGLFLGLSREASEYFSFALAVVLTPPVIVHQFHRLLKSVPAETLERIGILHLVTDGLLGMVFSFLTGLVALRFLSNVLEKGRWKYFGYYCFFVSGCVLTTHFLNR